MLHFFQQGPAVNFPQQDILQAATYAAHLQQGWKALWGKSKGFPPKLLDWGEFAVRGARPFPTVCGQLAFIAQQTLQPSGIRA